jgi:BRO family, N-terminal domain.
MTLTKFNFKINDITYYIITCKKNEEIYFKANDITKILGLKKNSLKNYVKSFDKITYDKLVLQDSPDNLINDNGNISEISIDNNTLFINKNGFRILLLKSKFPYINEVAKAFEINLEKKIISYDLKNIIKKLSIVFEKAEVKSKFNYSVKHPTQDIIYEIDCYLPVLRIGIYFTAQPTENINFLTSHLKCKFLNFEINKIENLNNSRSETDISNLLKSFNSKHEKLYIFEIIGEIIKEINKKNTEISPELTSSNGFIHDDHDIAEDVVANKTTNIETNTKNDLTNYGTSFIVTDKNEQTNDDNDFNFLRDDDEANIEDDDATNDGALGNFINLNNIKKLDENGDILDLLNSDPEMQKFLIEKDIETYKIESELEVAKYKIDKEFEIAKYKIDKDFEIAKYRHDGKK